MHNKHIDQQYNRTAEESRVEFYRRWVAASGSYFRWQAQLVSGYVGERIADIGCGLGSFADIYSQKEIFLAIDSDESVREELKKKNNTGNFVMAESGDICDDKSVQELITNRIDTVICFNTLEHIADDRRAVVNIVKGVKEGGHICIIVPALQFIYGTLDLFDGHYRRYSKKELLKLVENLPVNVEMLHYMNMIGSFGWFLKGRVLREKEYRSENFKINSALVPVISVLERWVRPPFGLSLVFVLRKM